MESYDLGHLGFNGIPLAAVFGINKMGVRWIQVAWSGGNCSSPGERLGCITGMPLTG